MKKLWNGRTSNIITVLSLSVAVGSLPIIELREALALEHCHVPKLCTKL